MAILTDLVEVVLVPLKKKERKKSPWRDESNFTVSFGKKGEFISIDALGVLSYYDGTIFVAEGEVSELLVKAEVPAEEKQPGTATAF